MRTVSLFKCVQCGWFF